ncbi:MAG: nicotinate-nucleotide adenylyltransferase, partial [Candidatus Nanopelagicales bacterium]
MRRVGVLGGTFDPVHHGHLVAASEAAYRLGLDQVLLAPAGRQWQKTRPDISPAEDRYAMTVIATDPDPRLAASRVDVDREGPTYTVDTLTDLRSELGPDVELFFITGADALAGLASWHRAEEIPDLAHLVGVTRPGHPLQGPGDLDLPAGSVTLLQIPALDVSSSECRARVAAGAPIRYLVPDGVAQYVA